MKKVNLFIVCSLISSSALTFLSPHSLAVETSTSSDRQFISSEIGSNKEGLEDDPSGIEVVIPETSETSESEEISPEVGEEIIIEVEPIEETDSSTSESTTVHPSTESELEQESELEVDLPQTESSNTTQNEGSYNFVPIENHELFISSIALYARKIAAENDLYASVLIAQACLETGFGNSALSSEPHFNLFGIKGAYNGESITFATHEEVNGKMISINDNFRSYPSYKESIQDYVDLLTSNTNELSDFYAGALKSNTDHYAEATLYLTGRYATDTNYNNKLDNIIEAYGLTRFDSAFVQKVEHTVQLGDTLNDISEKYETSLNEIISLNSDIVDPNVIEIGQKITVSEKSMNLPLTSYTISSNFGQRNEQQHYGIDLAAPANQTVFAASTGEVIETGFNSSTGNYVIIKHDNSFYTSYFHLNEVNVELNQTVNSLEQIGLVGSTGDSTGPHLHFAISESPWSDYYDPIEFLDFE